MRGEKALDFTVASIALLGIAGCTVIFLVSRRYKHIPVAAFVALALCCALGLSLYFFASSFSRARDLIAVGIGGALFTVCVYALMSGLSARRATQSATSGKPLVEFEEAPGSDDEDADEAQDEKHFEGLLTEVDEVPKKLWEDGEEDEIEGLSFENELIEAAAQEAASPAPEIPTMKEAESLAAAEELFELVQTVDDGASLSVQDDALSHGAKLEAEIETTPAAEDEESFEEYTAHSPVEPFTYIDLPFVAALDEQERKAESDAAREREDDAPFIPLFDFALFEDTLEELDESEETNIEVKEVFEAEEVAVAIELIEEEPIVEEAELIEVEAEPAEVEEEPPAVEEPVETIEEQTFEVEQELVVEEKEIVEAEEPVEAQEEYIEPEKELSAVEEPAEAVEEQSFELEEESVIEEIELFEFEEKSAVEEVVPVEVEEPAEVAEETFEAEEELSEVEEPVEAIEEQPSELEEEPVAEEEKLVELEEESAEAQVQPVEAQEELVATEAAPLEPEEMIVKIEEVPAEIEEEPIELAEEAVELEEESVEPEKEPVKAEAENIAVEEDSLEAEEPLPAMPEAEEQPHATPGAEEYAASTPVPDECALKEEAMAAIKASVAGGRYEEALTQVFALLRAGYALDENEKRRLLIIMKLLKEKGL